MPSHLQYPGRPPGSLSLLASSPRRLPCTLAQVVRSPQRLEVRVVAGLKKLGSIRQIKSSQGFDMVYVPSTVVLPGHTGLELRFQVDLQLGNRTAKILDSRAAPEVGTEGSSKARPERPAQSVFRIGGPTTS